MKTRFLGMLKGSPSSITKRLASIFPVYIWVVTSGFAPTCIQRGMPMRCAVASSLQYNGTGL